MASRRVSLGILPGLILVFAWLLAPATTVAGDPCYHGFELPARQVVATSQVKLEPCAFSPTIARVPVGATVTFANEGDFTHLVTGANQEWGSRDLELHPFSKVSYTFDKAGTYPYACALHRGMSGVIVVGDGGEASLAAPVASAAVPTGGTGPEPVALVAAAIAGGVLGAGLFALLVRARRHGVAAEPKVAPEVAPEPAAR